MAETCEAVDALTEASRSGRGLSTSTVASFSLLSLQVSLSSLGCSLMATPARCCQYQDGVLQLDLLTAADDSLECRMSLCRASPNGARLPWQPLRRRPSSLCAELRRGREPSSSRGKQPSSFPLAYLPMTAVSRRNFESKGNSNNGHSLVLPQSLTDSSLAASFAIICPHYSNRGEIYRKFAE